jgi:hypothetical protein
VLLGARDLLAIVLAARSTLFTDWDGFEIFKLVSGRKYLETQGMEEKLDEKDILTQS